MEFLEFKEQNWEKLDAIDVGEDLQLLDGFFRTPFVNDNDVYDGQISGSFDMICLIGVKTGRCYFYSVEDLL